MNPKKVCNFPKDHIGNTFGCCFFWSCLSNTIWNLPESSWEGDLWEGIYGGGEDHRKCMSYSPFSLILLIIFPIIPTRNNAIKMYPTGIHCAITKKISNIIIPSMRSSIIHTPFIYCYSKIFQNSDLRPCIHLGVIDLILI